MILAGSRARRYAVIGLGALAILVLLVVFFPWNLLRNPVAAYASNRLHRAVAIERFGVSPGWTTRVQLDGVTIGNAAWSQTQPMATVRSMIFTFRLPSSLRPSPSATRLVEPDVLLERNLPAAKATGTLAERTAGLLPRSGQSTSSAGACDTSIQPSRAHRRYAADGSGERRHASRAAVRRARHAARRILRDPGSQPGTRGASQHRPAVRARADARSGKTVVAFDGTVVPAEVQNVKGTLHIKGPDLSQLYPMVPSPLPWTPPYDLRGDLSHVNRQWILNGIKGTVGDSDLAGDFKVDVSSKRAATIADLTSRRFDYKERIGAAIGLGALAPPLALLPLIDLGDAPDADCRALHQYARVQTGTTERIARPNPHARKDNPPTSTEKSAAGRSDRSAGRRSAKAKTSASTAAQAADSRAN